MDYLLISQNIEHTRIKGAHACIEDAHTCIADAHTCIEDANDGQSDELESVILDIDDADTTNIAIDDTNIDDIVILNTNKPIIYPNQKIYTVAPIIEQNIIDRDNYQPSTCLLRCQNCIRMLLDFATYIYIYLEYIIKIFTIVLVHIDIFNITKSKLKIFGRSKFNQFVIEGANSEKLRRIVYWFYYNNITPDEDQWREVLTRFKLDEVPSFTMRLYNNNIKSIYSIELENMELQTYQDNVVIKGSRTINLYEDIVDSHIEGDIFIKCGKKKIGTVSSKIPVGGLMPEKFISDLNLNKIVNNVNKIN